MKQVVSLALLLCSASAFASDGTVTFTGTITDQACTITTKNVDVSFGTISASSFNGKGDSVGGRSFQLTLSNCPFDSATVRFDGNANAEGNLFQIDGGTDAATNVAIAIYDANNKQVLPNTPSSAYTLTSPTGTSTLNFSAKLQATDTTVGKGKIKAVSNFTVIYP
ncbi:type 1 fimbrial protein [Citrobacter amalonaticus]|uniref:Type 1 fimbrial protein n=1 Tax=Citrobacter amalonaticus TaxID=35703 RepID=A0A9C7V225_CITAM|nr:type 1 fimbrial protein [Citrobacter amalonaticus]HCD1255877.1 type 1 fimbrial protein [Citrobacter amalonaticus]